jgi:hypothetical protein
LGGDADSPQEKADFKARKEPDWDQFGQQNQKGKR